MVEMAFKVKKDSEFYSQYFKAKDERQKWHDRARAFFEKYDLTNGPCNYYMISRLAIEMNDDQRQRFTGQITKHPDKNNVTFFMRRSVMQKKWAVEVVDGIDQALIDRSSLWYWPYIGSGSYALWSTGDEIYGYLKDKNQTQIQKAEWMIPMKMSEYYAVMEALEEDPHAD